ncbi:MAG: C40 family peptidase [Nevskia sp.]|nr:C40 family peptidase [Nevskia sp.]
MRLCAALLLPTALVLGGCAGHRGENDNPIRESVVETALGQVGRPYRYGGSDPSGFDCSGLVQYSYGQAGVKVPRSSDEQRSAGSRIDLDEARPGDLLFYRFGDKGLHVAIYLGHHEMVHAPESGRQVSVIHIDQAPWPNRFVGAVRVLQ